MSSGSTSSTRAAAGDLLSAGTRLGRELLDLALRDPAGLVGEAQSAAARAVRSMSGLGASTCRCGGACGGACEIPDPCWMPTRLARVVSPACPGATATLRVTVTNGGLGPRQVTVEASGEHAKAVSITPGSRTLGTFESHTFVATTTVPADGTGFEVLLWVRGCREYAVPWRVAVSDRGCSTCHEVTVEDCPDLVHHWYDHFYCERPCPHGDVRVATHG